MKPIFELLTDLFGTERIMKPSKNGKDARILDERASLLSYFHSRARDRQDKEYPIAYIGMRLSHLKLEDLYFLKSTCAQEIARGVPFGKVFWGSIRVKKVN